MVEISGEIDYVVRCFCPSCTEIDHMGLLPDLFQDKEGKIVPGTYYLRAWFEEHPGGPWGPTEYDGGLQLALDELKSPKNS